MASGTGEAGEDRAPSPFRLETPDLFASTRITSRTIGSARDPCRCVKSLAGAIAAIRHEVIATELSCFDLSRKKRVPRLSEGNSRNPFCRRETYDVYFIEADFIGVDD